LKKGLEERMILILSVYKRLMKAIEQTMIIGRCSFPLKPFIVLAVGYCPKLMVQDYMNWCATE
jgi:hypothetical protein